MVVHNSLFRTPVVFLLFNRPDSTRKVFQRIRGARPPCLLVVADGPRQDRLGEAELCRISRAVIDEVDWPCTVERNFSDENQGCKRRVASGLDWAFTLVKEAIILEDDCLPDPSFFFYCQELLDRYRNDERVMSISGDNFLEVSDSGKESYRFSHICHIWGWATWRRSWQNYDITMSRWPEFRERGGFRLLFGKHEDMIHAWTQMMERAYNGEVDTWDFQWMFASFVCAGLQILPRKNLIANIGFSVTATHTNDPGSWQANLPIHAADNPLVHPLRVQANCEADYKTYCRTLRGPVLQLLFHRWKQHLSTGLRKTFSSFPKLL